MKIDRRDVRDVAGETFQRLMAQVANGMDPKDPANAEMPEDGWRQIFGTSKNNLICDVTLKVVDTSGDS
jgi:hypothetical protein